MKKWILYVLIISLVLSIIANVFLTLAFIGLDMVWEDEFTENEVGWCIVINEYSRYINDLTLELQANDPIYDEIEMIEIDDCLEIYNGEK